MKCQRGHITSLELKQMKDERLLNTDSLACMTLFYVTRENSRVPHRLIQSSS